MIGTVEKHCNTLHEQLYSPQLLRLLRSGADRLCYRAEEEEEFDVSKGMYFGT